MKNDRNAGILRRSGCLKFLTAALILTLSSSLFVSCTEKNSTQSKEQTAVTDVQTSLSGVTETHKAVLSEKAEPDSQKAQMLQKKYGLTKETYPHTDGTFSSVAVSGGLKSVYFGETLSESETGEVSESDEEAYNNLLDSKADAVFIHELSDEQKSAAAQAGFETESVPVSKEALVFMVSRDNPVDSLTSEQLRKIYSGEITNWKVVGGNDEPCDAYQRCAVLPAQKMMQKFMGDLSLAEPASEIMDIDAGQFGGIARIPDYINSSFSIGYCIYSRSLECYLDDLGIKLISVDGVKPDDISIGSGDYTLTWELFYTFSARDPEDSPVRKLAEYIKSDDGMTAVMSSLNIENQMNSLGTGPKKTESCESQIIYYSARPDIVNIGSIDIKNKLMDMEASLDNGEHLDLYAINGYLFAYTNGKDHSVSMIFDLLTGKQLQFSDIFYEGTDYISYYNNKISENLQNLQFGITDEEYYERNAVKLKREFCGITDDCTLSLTEWSTGIYFPAGNPYFSDEYYFTDYSYDDFLYKNSVIYSKPVDMEDVFGKTAQISCSTAEIYEEVPDFTYRYEGMKGSIRLNKMLYKSSFFDGDKTAKINSKAREMAADQDTADILENKYYLSTAETSNLYGPFGYNGYVLDIDVYKEKNIFTVSIYYMSKADPWYPALVYFYDCDSLQKLSNKQVLKSFFGENYQSFSEDALTDEDYADDDQYCVSHFHSDKDLCLIEFSSKENDGRKTYLFTK